MGAVPKRRADLVRAAIHEIGLSGTLDVTVGQIARRAGVSAALAFHYFGDKDRLFLAAMRHVLSVYGAEVREALAAGSTPRARLEGLVRASFSASNFRQEIIAAWLNFYVMAQRSPEAARLLAIYHRRLHSNLVHDLRPLAGNLAPAIAERLGGLIDGLYLRCAVAPATPAAATAHVLAALDNEIAAARLTPETGN